MKDMAEHGQQIESLSHRPGAEPTDAFGDRSIEYLWGGPKLNWFRNPPGIEMSGDFDTWTRDLTIDWGGYLTNDPTATDGDEMFIAAPLGPRWSCWHLDICYGRGPDHGILNFQVATAPFFRTCDGVPTINPTGNERYDIAAPDSLGDYDLTWFDLPGWTVDGYNASELFNSNTQEVGSTIRITGEYGQMLGNVDTGECEPLTGQSFDSGDGLVYYFRLFLNGQNASSSGFKFRIQAVRLVRAIENDGTII